MDALMAKIVDEEPTAIVKWSLDDADPIKADDVAATEYAAPGQNLYQLTVLDGAADGGGKQLSSTQRFQTIPIAIRTYTYERTAADMGRSLVRHIRKIQDWVETFNAATRGKTNWSIDWISWSSIRDDSGRAPTPGARILGAIHIYQ